MEKGSFFKLGLTDLVKIALMDTHAPNSFVIMRKNAKDKKQKKELKIALDKKGEFSIAYAEGEKNLHTVAMPYNNFVLLKTAFEQLITQLGVKEKKTESKRIGLLLTNENDLFFF
eukprot:TRINITY_DN12725_c0_g1_i6.p1 TRINITY_DN12725_c0_g1~~TRINITY_DN12725_c0_g1_i6.p1  ORF type:complete len:115 (-),score=31.42 TRINITY_DN12725_c0_g1_i6:23-367(-)